MVILNNKEFDIIGRLKDYFCKVSETILKLDNPNEKITPDMIKLVDDNEQEKLVLNYKKKIELETFMEIFLVNYQEIQNLFLNII